MNLVRPSGPVPCDLALFGEAPGFEEQMEGRPFVGKSGKQLWPDVQRFTGLTRDDFYVSNIIKYGLPKNRDPKPHEIAAAIPDFLDELERVQPRVVVTAGGFATRVLLGDVKMSDVHGIPHTVEIAGRKLTCFPLYHPAAGLHAKGFLSAFAFDLDRLKSFLAGDLRPWAPCGRPARVEWLAEPLRGQGEGFWHGPVGVDTEGWPEHPWGVSFSFPAGSIDVAYVIRASSTRTLQWFSKWLKGKTIAMHNGLHDIPVLRAMGVPIDTYHDTQVLAFHDMTRTGSGVLEAESQNLGTLAYRELGTRLGELSDLPGVDLDASVIPYTDSVRDYAGADAIAARRLFETYDARGLTALEPYQIDMGQVPLVEGMIRYGLPFDEQAAFDYYADVLEKLTACTLGLQQMAARFGLRNFNPGSHLQVRELITRKIGLRIRKRTKGGLASTNEKALADHQDHPFVKKLQEYRELVKLRGTYVGPLLEELCRT